MFFLGVVLFRHHGEGGCCGDGAEAGFGEVRGFVVFGVAELEDLVGGEGGGGEADDEVDFLAEVGVVGEVVDDAFD